MSEKKARPSSTSSPISESKAFFTYEDGVYWPTREARTISGALWYELVEYQNRCEHLPDNRGIRIRQEKPKWLGSLDEITVYSEADLDAIYRSKAGIKELTKPSARLNRHQVADKLQLTYGHACKLASEGVFGKADKHGLFDPDRVKVYKTMPGRRRANSKKKARENIRRLLG